jgi:hypothetical protein
VGRETGGDMSIEGVEIDRAHHHCRDDLSPTRIVDAEDAARVDPRKEIERPLDFTRVNIFAPGNEQLGASTEHVEISGFVESAFIRGAKPTVLVERQIELLSLEIAAE